MAITRAVITLKRESDELDVQLTLSSGARPPSLSFPRAFLSAFTAGGLATLDFDEAQDELTLDITYPARSAGSRRAMGPFLDLMSFKISQDRGFRVRKPRASGREEARRASASRRGRSVRKPPRDGAAAGVERPQPGAGGAPRTGGRPTRRRRQG